MINRHSKLVAGLWTLWALGPFFAATHNLAIVDLATNSAAGLTNFSQPFDVLDAVKFADALAKSGKIAVMQLTRGQGHEFVKDENVTALYVKIGEFLLAHDPPN